jgi:hypothetical protein
MWLFRTHMHDGSSPDVFFGGNDDNHSDYRCGSHALWRRWLLRISPAVVNNGLYFVVDSLVVDVCGFSEIM